MRKTKVDIQGNKFLINGEIINKGKSWRGIPVEGLLFNSRMVQAIFDDKNPETVSKWAYPDTGVWDRDRNTQEFIDAMPQWKDHGVICITLNLQGGNPEGYIDKQPWHNSAFLEDGSLDEEYIERLERILDRSDELGMVVILGFFYFGQDRRLRDEEAIITATRNATEWVLSKGYTNVMIEVDNECDAPYYTQSVLKDQRVHELIKFVKSMSFEGRRLFVSTSFGGGTIPSDNVANIADFILVHGNGVEDPNYIEKMVITIKKMEAYQGQPIIFNEDDHFEFDKENNNFLAATKNGASWGYFEPGLSNYKDGYQAPPVNWGINTPQKKAFFTLVKEITEG